MSIRQGSFSISYQKLHSQGLSKNFTNVCRPYCKGYRERDSLHEKVKAALVNWAGTKTTYWSKQSFTDPNSAICMCDFLKSAREITMDCSKPLRICEILTLTLQ